MRRFKAEAVAPAEMLDLDCFVVVLAECRDGSGARLELQRALSFDEQDRALGQDAYCVSTESGATCYGGVVSWRLAGRTLEIVLSPEAAEALGVTGGFVIEVGEREQTRDELKRGLERVLSLSRVISSQPGSR